MFGRLVVLLMFAPFKPFLPRRSSMPLMPLVQFMQRMALSTLATEGGGDGTENHGERCAKGPSGPRARSLGTGLSGLALDRLFTRLLCGGLRLLRRSLCLSLSLRLQLTQRLLKSRRQLAYLARAWADNDNPREP